MDKFNINIIFDEDTSSFKDLIDEVLEQFVKEKMNLYICK